MVSESLPLTFTAIDFETASHERNSACSVGLAVVEDGEVTSKHHWLVRPPSDYFAPYNVGIHGITQEMVAREPRFCDLWPEISALIRGPLLAHNASFDISVLRHTLDAYRIPYPELWYFCSYLLARDQWPGLLSYSLDMVAHHLGLPLAHHQAADDALASALVVVLAARQSTLSCLMRLLEARGQTMGQLYPGGYVPAQARCHPLRTGRRGNQIEPRTDCFDEAHPLYGCTVVFTGTLQSMPRLAAKQAVVDVGGHCADSVSRDVDYLVVGDQDFSLLKGHTKSSKTRRAEELCQQGYRIEIVSENNFLRLLRG